MPTGLVPPPPVEGAEVCFVPVVGDPLCTSAGAEGDYVLAEVPSHVEGAVRFQHESIATFYHLLVPGTDDLELTLTIETPTVIENFYTATQTSPGPDGVVVLAEIFPQAKAGYSASLEPSSGTGPYYYQSWNANLDLEATETNVNVAMAVFLDVDRNGGPYDVVFDAGAGACTTPSMGEERSAFSVPADADIVYLQFACP